MGGIECSTPECGRPAAKGGLCWTCIKRRQRHVQQLVAPHAERPKDPLRFALDVSFDFYEIKPTDKEAWAKAVERFRWALRRYSDARVERAVRKLRETIDRLEAQLQSNPKHRKRRIA